jgi:hypothetical protein
MRKLPKRVITYEGKEFFPQVWFIWWHYIWDTNCVEFWRGFYFKSVTDAVNFMEFHWQPDKKPVKKIVWRSRDAKES